ncbi:MAG: glycosyltransferase family 2 protein [Candidatus Nomurabacteria bacterium]|nr:MAG: glycosyltransferase family 2 protein [Candidatus Nomurabacteria bacterium]
MSQTPMTVIIVSWNVRELVLQCIAALLQSRQNPEDIIVVDNASQDGSLRSLKEKYPNITLIANSKNVGFAKAVNQGIRAAKPGHMLLLNPDAIVKIDTLSKVKQVLEQEENIGVLGCRLVNEDGTTQESIRAFPQLSDQLLIMLKLHRFFPRFPALKRYYASSWNYTQDGEVDQVKGAFFLIHKNAIEQVGLLDEDYFIWFEEVDYCYRVKKAGLKVFYTSQAEVFHARGESFRQVLSITKQRYFIHSMQIYFAKHGSRWDTIVLRLARPLSLFLAALAAPLSMLKLKTPTAHD